VARISVMRPVAPAHSSPGTGLEIGREPLLYFLYSQPSLVPITRATIRMVEAMANFSATSMRAGIPG
jgi:hypothetical protein